MTISSTTRKAGPYVGNDVTTVFPFTFKVFSKADVYVLLTTIATGAESVLVLDDPAGYTVALNADQDANPGGSITYNPSGVPLSTTHEITISSAVAMLQTLALTIGGGFSPSSISAALDRAIILLQQQALVSNSGLRVSISEDAPANLPPAVERALNYLAFDADGDPIASSGTPGSVPVSVAMEPVVAAASLAAARALLKLTTTRGDLIRGGAGGVEERFALGGIGRILKSDGTDALWGNLLTAVNISTSATITEAQLNSLLVSATDAAVYTMPVLTAAMDGCIAAFTNNGGATVFFNVAAGAGNDIFDIAAQGTITVGSRETIILVPSFVNSRWYVVSTTAQHYPAGHFWGGTLTNNAGDATNDIDFAATYCRDATDVANIKVAALTKQLDVVWAAGTNAGMLDTGVVGNNTYHLWAIKNPVTGATDYLASLSASAPTMPAGYTLKRYMWPLLRTGGANKAFAHHVNTFLWNTLALDVNNATPSATPANVTLTLPTGVKVIAHVAFIFYSTTGVPNGNYVFSPDQGDASAATGTVGQYYLRASDDADGHEFRIRTNTSAQVRYDSSGAGGGYYVQTYGFTFERTT